MSKCKVLGYKTRQMQKQGLSETQLLEFREVTSRFKVNKDILLGKGANASVYLGYDMQNEQHIAVKYVSEKEYCTYKDFIDRECGVMASLQHPNIIKYIGREVSQYDGLYIFLELCQKNNLQKMIIDRRITEEDTKRLFRHLVDGMVYMNQQKIFHRDLKPENLLLSKDGNLKIADFGMARIISNQMLDHTEFNVGSPYYSSLEMLEHAGYNELSDVYSAGYILFEMLTGKKILQKDMDQYQPKTKHETPAFMIRQILRKKRDQGGWKFIPPTLKQRQHWLPLLLKMLEFNPEKRISFDEVKIMLTGISTSASLPPSPTNTPAQLERSAVWFRKIQFYLQFKDYQNSTWLWILDMLKKPQLFSFAKIPNLYKLLLLFLSVFCYCIDVLFLSDTLAKKGREFIIENQSFDNIFQKLTGVDRKNITTLLDKKVIALNLLKENAKRVFDKAVGPHFKKIMNSTIMDKQRRVIEELNLINNVRNSYEQNEVEPLKVFSKPFTTLVGYLYKTESELILMNKNDVRTYLALLLLSQKCLDNYQCQVQEMNQFRSGSAPSLSRMAEMSLQELLQEVRKAKKGKGQWMKKKE